MCTKERQFNSVQQPVPHAATGAGAAATPAMPLGTATADSTAAPAASPTAEPPDGQTALQTAKAPAAGPARQDAGLAEAQAQAKAGNAAAADDTLHSVITSSGSGYQNFQGRVMWVMCLKNVWHSHPPAFTPAFTPTFMPTMLSHE
eukprot:357589-Chlamydomonas_euryale.AAC.2